jgi:GR25 family glycosyltransferase involved in LPS biosynthesis
MGFNLFDGTVYINLSHRMDRKQQILDELEEQKVDKEKIHRIEGVFDLLNGHRGCCLSHIKALEYAIEKKWKNVLIFEDDCIFTRTPEKSAEIVRSLIEKADKAWDVFFIGGRIMRFGKTPIQGLNKAYSVRCAHAYAVNAPYFEHLRSLYLSSLELMKNELFFVDAIPYAIDIQWDTLMEKDRWYFTEIFAQQRGSFSDIRLEYRDRTVRENFD